MESRAVFQAQTQVKLFSIESPPWLWTWYFFQLCSQRNWIIDLLFIFLNGFYVVQVSQVKLNVVGTSLNNPSSCNAPFVESTQLAMPVGDLESHIVLVNVDTSLFIMFVFLINVFVNLI